MVDLQILRARGITQDALKAKFTSADAGWSFTPQVTQGSESQQTDKDKFNALCNRIRSRVQEGVQRNLADWQWIYALDKAWDTPFRQLHPKLFGSLEGGDMKSTCQILQSLNLGELVETYKNAKNEDCYRISEDKFTLLVGLVRSYTTIRWAKIVNDRRLTPFLKYEPAKVTTANRTKCELLTDRVQVMSTQYGYFDVMKQAVLKMLHYGVCLQFIKEEWHTEEQLKYATKQDVESRKKNHDYKGEAKDQPLAKEGDCVEYVEREGLRYEMPHLSRVFRDLAHPLYTINYDSGCSYAGFWQVMRYREIKSSNLWNIDKISLGNTSLIDTASLYFQTAYTGCTMKMATAAQVATGSVDATAGVGVGANDREKELVNQFYGSSHEDQGALLTNYFEKLVPSENGLGDYNYPVWFRFVLAGDGCTVLYAAPLPSCPMIYYGYDADESRKKNASLALEILPYQYQFENLLDQIVRTCKQNLANFTMVNTDVLDDTQIKKMEGLGATYWQKLNLFGASFKKLFKIFQRSSGGNTQDLGITLGLPKGNVAELVNVLKTILDVLERVLVMSSHEVAQAASHEQTREEVRNIASSTSSRLTFTSTPVDIARDAQKRQIYCYLMQYGDDDFYGHIPADNAITKEQLDSLGFSYVDNDALAGKEKYRRITAKKKSLALPLYEFASTRDGEDRSSDRESAAIWATFARDLMQSPIAPNIGPDQFIDLANRIAFLSGLDRDFKLRNVGGTPEQQQAEAQAQLKQVVDVVMQQVDANMQKALTPLLENVEALNESQKRDQIEIGLLMRIAKAAPEHPSLEERMPEMNGQ